MALLKEFSVQLYSVRDVVQKDVADSFSKIGKLGYSGVEFAGYYGLSANDVKKLLSDNGLKSIGSHVGMDRLENNLEEEIAFNKTIGTEYIILPWYQFEKGRDDVMRLCEKLNPIEEKINKAGMKTAYHNHAHEFAKDGDDYLLDILFANAPKILVELDMYWVAYAGLDPLVYMENYPNRCRLLHLKQIESYDTKKCVDLDKGVIDFKAVIEKGKKLGVEHYILEQEEFEVGPFESLKAGYDHIMSL